MPFFAMQKSLFRAYDIRGHQRYFTVDFITALGSAFAELYQNHAVLNHKNHQGYDQRLTIVIGFDVRNGSDIIAYNLMQTLQQQALSVINLGLITTPMMAFWAQKYNGHGIIVTASHSTKETLGIKWLVANTSPSQGDIEQLYSRLTTIDTLKSRHNRGITSAPSDAQTLACPIIHLPVITVMASYIDTIKQVFNSINSTHNLSINVANHVNNTKLNLTLVIDCMHGATSPIAALLFKQFVQRVILLNDTPNGDFPTGNPDPTEPNRLTELQHMVITHDADIGMAFDGDGDRLVVVDDSGKIVNPDHLLYLLAQVALTERPQPQSMMAYISKPQVLFDIKCSHQVSQLLTILGATPIMTKTGSSLLRRQLKTRHCEAIFAGELSGHFIFNDGYFMAYDDAMYAGLRLLHWLVYTAYTLSAITQDLPTLISTADHYLPLPANISNDCHIIKHLATLCHCLKPLIVGTDCTPTVNNDDLILFDARSSCTCFADWKNRRTQIQQSLPADTQLSCIDGVRLDFAHGFGVLRKSNTSHSLTVRFAGDSKNDLKSVQTHFVILCRVFDSHLAAQIAAIDTE